MVRRKQTGQRPLHFSHPPVDVQDSRLPCDCECPRFIWQQQNVPIIRRLFHPQTPLQKIPAYFPFVGFVPGLFKRWRFDTKLTPNLVTQVNAVNMTIAAISA
jgi:hypothetical protein